MSQSYKTEFSWILCLLEIGILLQITGIHPAFVDRSLDSPCVCMDDVLFEGGDPLRFYFSSGHDCLCTNVSKGHWILLQKNAK